MPRPRSRRRGIALLLAISMVMVLTIFIGEYFFETRLNMQALAAFEQHNHSERLANQGFRTVIYGLSRNEKLFYLALGRIKEQLGSAVLPWNGGTLSVSVKPMEQMFYVNSLNKIQPNSATEYIRWNIFKNTLAKATLLPNEQRPLGDDNPSEMVIADSYAQITDLVDGNQTPYAGYANSFGDEYPRNGDYDIDYEYKNAPLELLSELRVVPAVQNSEIPWGFWRNNFSELPASSADLFYPEKININVASAAEIKNFLTDRKVDNLELLSGAETADQEGINKIADKADEILAIIMPKDLPRSYFANVNEIAERLSGVLTERAERNQIEKLFIVQSQYYYIRIEAKYLESTSFIESTVFIQRDQSGAGVKVDVLSFLVY